MLSSSSSSKTLPILQRFKFKKIVTFVFFKPFSLLKSLALAVSSAMDDVFDPDEFLAVDSASTFDFDDDDDDILIRHTRRRRRINPPSTSLPLRDDRLFLVDYKWWNDARKECESDLSVVLYSAVAATASSEDDVDDGNKECESNDDDEIVLNFKREACDDDDGKRIDITGEGFCGREYALISESMWFKALKWHSDYCTKIKEIGYCLAAEDEKQDEKQGVFPIQIRLSMMWQTISLLVKISLMDNPVKLYKRAYQIFDLQSDSVCIWDFSGHMTQFFEGDASISTNDCAGQATEEVLLELQVYGLPNFSKDAEIRSREIAMQSKYSSAGPHSSCSTKINGTVENQSSYSPFPCSQSCSRGYGETGILGLKGLSNLGNTCFMNSAIQCLAHTPKLIDYFLGNYKKEINCENPLGMNGELALAFGDLLRNLWAPGGKPIAPKYFKSTLERFAPQFCGYNQHDSQEFLAFLLDGLHEDLNRVKHKPYIQVGDTEGRSDDTVAEEYWQCYLARNDSIIVDLCHGQFQSTLVCPICKRVSITFDPFMYLSLPLPSATRRTMTVTVLSTDGSMPPSILTVTVPKFGRCKDLIQALGMASSLRDDETLFVAEVYNNSILRSLEDPSDSLALIRDDDRLVAYRIPKESDNSQLVVFMHQRSERLFGFRTSRPEWSLFGIPLVARIPCISDGSQIYEEYVKLLSPFKKPEDDCDDTGNSSKEPVKMESEIFLCSDNSWSSDDETVTDLHVASDFQFHFTDTRGLLGFRRIKLGKPVDVSGETGKLNVLVSWSEKMLSQYDTSRFSLLPEVCKSGIFAMKPQETVSLYKCLEGFLKEEPLGPEDMWYCPSCKEHRQASKKLGLRRLPEILVVHLKRFSYSRFLKNKLETYVDFPIDKLDLTSFLSHESTPCSSFYQLYAISNHYGSMGGGHYTALVYHGNGWYEFNDNIVEPVREEDIKSSAAYVLFYRRIADT